MDSSLIARVLRPFLERIIKNASWRKHSALVSSCKSTLDLLETLPESSSGDDPFLLPLILALESSSPKVAEPALEAIHRLFSLFLLRAEINESSRLLASVCASGAMGEESLELGMLRVLLAAVQSAAVSLRGECLVQIVKSCCNVCLGSQSAFNQLCAKISLAQILIIVFARVEADSVDVTIRMVEMGEVFDLGDKGLNDANLVLGARDFVSEAMGGGEVEVIEEKLRQFEVREGGGMSKIREDGFVLFKNLCKFSMKFAAPGENPEDPILLRGKVLSLELLKMVMENAGSFWLVNER